MLHCLVGNVVDMSTTCLRQAQMSENFEKDTNVHDTENFFCFESRVCGMSWSEIVSDRGVYKKKFVLH